MIWFVINNNGLVLMFGCEIFCFKW